MINVARKKTQLEIEQIRKRNAMIRDRQQFLLKQQNWDKKDQVVNALFSGIRHRMKNKKATMVGQNAKMKNNLSLIPEGDEGDEGEESKESGEESESESGSEDEMEFKNQSESDENEEQTDDEEETDFGLILDE
jgi:hypothetical protein